MWILICVDALLWDNGCVMHFETIIGVVVYGNMAMASFKFC